MTPEQEEQVRRALASAGPAPQLPPEVAARLDATLAGLVAGRSDAPDAVPDAEAVAGPVAAPLDELEQRRRRRWPRVLVAAAGVAVLAYGGGVVLEGLQVSGGDAASTAARDETFAGAGAGAESEDRSAPDAPGVMPPSTGAGDGLVAQGGKAGSARALSTRTVRLHRDTLVEDVGRLIGRTALVDEKSAGADDAGRPGSVAALVAPCAVPTVTRAVGYAPARLDGVPATLVVRRDTDGTRVAEVYACGDPARRLAVAPVRR